MDDASDKADEADEAARARARRRADWPIERKSLNEPSSDDISGTTTIDERLAIVWELTLASWRLTGRPLPDYERSAAPIRRSTLEEQ